MKKTILFFAMMVAGLTLGVQAQTIFSATSPSYHTLYYKVIDESNHWVELINPNNTDGIWGEAWENYSAPWGNVVIPQTVTNGGTTWTVKRIGHSAFASCTTVKRITLPDGIDSIKSYAFFNTEIDSVNIPNTVTYIGSSNFHNPQLRYLHLPASLEYIDPWEQDGSGILACIVDEGNPYYRSIDGCLVKEDDGSVELITYPRGRVNGVVEIPEGVTRADCWAMGIDNATKLIVPSTMTYICPFGWEMQIYDTIVLHKMLPPQLAGSLYWTSHIELPCGSQLLYGASSWGQYANLFATSDYLPQTDYTQTITYGESYAWGDLSLTERGIYEDTLQSVVEGCDSVHRVLTLNVVQYYRSDTLLTGNMSVDFRGLTVDRPGVYDVLVPGEGEGDSLFVLRASAQVNATLATVLLGGVWDGQSIDLPAMQSQVFARGEDTITITNVHQTIFDTVDVTIAEGESHHGYTLAGVYQDTIVGADADSIVRSRLSMTVNRPMDSCTVQLGSNQAGSFSTDAEFYTAVQVIPSESRQIVFSPGITGTNLIANGDFENSNIESFITDYATPDSPGSAYRTYSHQGGNGVDGSNCIYFDGSEFADQACISATISTIPDCIYRFSYMARNTGGDNPPYFQVKINGVAQNGTDVVPQDGNVWTTFEYVFTATTGTTTVELVDLRLEGNGNDFYIDNFTMVQTNTPSADTITITNTHGLVRDTLDVTIAEGESYHGYTLAGVYQDTIVGANTDSTVRSRVSITVNRPMDSCTVQLGGNMGGTYFNGEEFYAAGSAKVQVLPSESKTLLYSPETLGVNLLTFTDENYSNYSQFCGDYCNSPDCAEYGDWMDRGVDGSTAIYFRGSCDAGLAFFRAALNTRAGEQYLLRYMATAGGNPERPILALKVNGVQMSRVDTLENCCMEPTWGTFEHLITATSDTTTIELINLQGWNTQYWTSGMYHNEWFMDNFRLMKVYATPTDSITITNTHGLVRDTVNVTINEGESYHDHTLAGIYQDTIIGSETDSLVYARVSMNINHTFGAGSTTLATNQDRRVWMGLDDNTLSTQPALIVQVAPTEEKRYVLTSLADDKNLVENSGFEQGAPYWGGTGYAWHDIPFYGSHYVAVCDSCGRTGMGMAIKGSVFSSAQFYSTNAFDVIEGHRYSFCYWAKNHAENPAEVTVHVHAYGDVQPVVTIGGTDTLDSYQWRCYEHVFTAQASYSAYVELFDLNKSASGNEFFFDDIMVIDLTEAANAHRDTITVSNIHQLHYATVDTTINEGESYNGHSTAGVYNDTLVLADYDSIVTARVSYVLNTTGEGIATIGTNREGTWFDLDNNNICTVSTVSVYPTEVRTFGLFTPLQDTNLIVNGDFEQGNTGFTSHFLYRPEPYDLGDGTYYIGGYRFLNQDDNHYLYAYNYWWPEQGALYETTVTVEPNTWYRLSYRGVSNALRGDVTVHPYGNDNTVKVNGQLIGTDTLTYSASTDMSQAETFTYYIYNANDTAMSLELNTNYGEVYNFAYDDITLTPLAVVDTVTITNRHQLVYDTLSSDLCMGDTLTVDGVDYSATGTYTLPTQYYTDSTVHPTLVLAVHDNYYPQLTGSICEGASYTFGGNALTETGIYTDSLLSAYSCDSTVTLTLTVYDHTAATFDEVACDSYSWLGENLTASLSRTDTLPNVHGCDSVVTLNLTVKYSTTGDTAATACDAFSWYGQNYAVSGTPTHTLTNVAGCDSTLTLNLTVNYSTAGSETLVVCDSVTWQGTLRNASGDYVETLTNAVSCDSTVTLHLTVNPTYQHTDAVFACDNQLPYLYHEASLAEAGEHTVTLQSAEGCDSTLTVTLTVGTTYQHTDAVTLCQSGMPYTYGDRTFDTEDTTGTYMVPFATVEGCDSIITLGLTVHESEETEIYVVTVSSTHNVVVWDRNAVVDHYNIYRESSTAGNYQLMAEVPFSSENYWTDTLSDARARSYRYRISSVDSCGTESAQSSVHKTMHLTISQGINNSWNLVWTEYEGTTYTTYRIYRGDSYSTLEMIDEIPAGGNTTYTDYNAPLGDVYYQIVILMTPMGAKDEHPSTITSNVATNAEVGIGSVATTEALIYVKDGSIVVEAAQGAPIRLYDVAGRRLYEEASIGHNRFEVPNAGAYMVKIGNAPARRVVVM